MSVISFEQSKSEMKLLFSISIYKERYSKTELESFKILIN